MLLKHTEVDPHFSPHFHYFQTQIYSTPSQSGQYVYYSVIKRKNVSFLRVFLRMLLGSNFRFDPRYIAIPEESLRLF